MSRNTLFQIFPIILVCSFAISMTSCENSTAPSTSYPNITTESGVEMVLLPGGEFEMGGPLKESLPIHTVRVSPFAIDKFEVIQDELKRLEISDPSYNRAKGRPTEQLKWSDAVEICNARSKAEGLTPCYDMDTFECNFDANGYRLPTEAEWEYACRGGTTAEHFFEDKKAIGSYAVVNVSKGQPVGTKRPNPFGLYDMAGNVQEWCNDRYSEEYYASSPKDDPKGPKEGKKRILRGGSFKSGVDGTQSYYRHAAFPGYDDACHANETYGFRCVRKLSADELKQLESNGSK